MTPNKSHQKLKLFQQLNLIEKRRLRILDSVSAHFGREHVLKVLKQFGASPNLEESYKINSEVERFSTESMDSFARDLIKREAVTVGILRKHLSKYPEHVEEQILFGAKTSGQDAAREVLGGTLNTIGHSGKFTIPETIQIIFDLTFYSAEAKQPYFLIVRNFGPSTVHYQSNPYSIPEAESGASEKFMYEIRSAWIKGILEIISPQTDFVTTRSLENGDNFGLAHFINREEHAGP